ncbi:HAD hydrolase family protein [Paenibacillus sp. S3N08]|uniref:HAD hydrolase family protein n=2 Tax=Paenibacillus agricola TaxID=2716264 RepID=A0ABX0J5F1_9BACL|nr:HAD hydrolase family protein [Paenibacillus agricola]
MKKIYALTDLDGTLLQPDATLSSYTMETLTELLAEGHIISYATARSYTSSQAVAGEIPWKYPMVLYNGALLYDPVGQVVLDGVFLDLPLTNELIRLGKQFGLCPLLFGLDEEGAERVLHESLVGMGYKQFVMSRPGDVRFREIVDLSCPDNIQTLLLTYIGHYDELKPLLDAVQIAYAGRIHIHFMADTYIEDHYFLEFSDIQANKGNGLKMWARSVGCSTDEVIAFGDNLNDIGLLQEAGRKVAVGNAKLELKVIADQIIGTNIDNAVAHYLVQEMQYRDELAVSLDLSNPIKKLSNRISG